ncbi:MAG: ion transporter [Bacteroidales bacterium]|nr:ion transporter [Bacteroidales bacterium]
MKQFFKNIYRFWKKVYDSIQYHKQQHTLKEKLYVVIFESDTWSGKLFDVVLIGFIVASIALIILDSMHLFSSGWGTFLRVLEWIITLFFTIEYILRVYCVPDKKKYIFSFYGIIDLLSTLPTYLGIFFTSANYLLLIRTFRLIRVFRVFRLFSFLSEGNLILQSLKESRKKIFVFFSFICLLALVIGTIMYVLEKDEPGTGFDNIPNSIYWTIVTMTTVGYGDITPTTSLGRFISACVMLIGYTIIAIPTGIVSVNIAKNVKGRTCKHCGRPQHDNDKSALYCKYCGKELDNNQYK